MPDANDADRLKEAQQDAVGRVVPVFGLARSMNAILTGAMRVPGAAWAVVGGCVVVVVGLVSWKYGAATAVLILAGVALLLVIGALFRTFQIIAEPNEDAESDELVRAPTAAESRKTTALRALRDLETERSLGNVSDADYADLLARYRNEAKEAMRALDEERAERRAIAEKLAAREVATVIPREDVVVRPDAPPPAIGDDEAAAAVAPGEDDNPFADHAKKCPTCGVENDDDAKFCKACATALSSVSA